jgi:steroid 5-alpha reductase family enzyme
MRMIRHDRVGADIAGKFAVQLREPLDNPVPPVFVCWLLTKVSGIPLLEQRADEKWGGQTDYEAYKAATPVLLPWPPRRPAR